MTYKNCPPVLESYLRYLKTVKGNAPKTLDVRYRDVKTFLTYLVHREKDAPLTPRGTDERIKYLTVETIAAVTEADIEDYLDYLAEDLHLTDVTIQQRKLPSLRQFYNYIFRYQEELGVTLLRIPVRQCWEMNVPAKSCRILSPAEISRVLDAIEKYEAMNTTENHVHTPLVIVNPAVRDKAIVLLIATTGVSTSELVKIRCRDYIEDTMIIAGRKVHLTEACREALDTYLTEFRDSIEATYADFHENALFVSHNYRRRMTDRGIQNALKKHFARAGVTGTARDLRYTAMAEMFKSARNECELAYIAGRFGYNSPTTAKQLLQQMGIPSPGEGKEMPDLISGTWLDSIGKKKE